MKPSRAYVLSDGSNAFLYLAAAFAYMFRRPLRCALARNCVSFNALADCGLFFDSLAQSFEAVGLPIPMAFTPCTARDLGVDITELGDCSEARIHSWLIRTVDHLTSDELTMKRP